MTSEVTQMDATEEFKRSIANCPFQSFDDFSDKLQLFQQESGFIFRKRDAIKLPPISPDFQRLVYKRVYYVCIHYGSYKSTAVNPLKHRTIRCDCPAAFYLLMKDSVLTVKKFRMVHNHPPEPVTVTRRRLFKRAQVVELPSLDHRFTSAYGDFVSSSTRTYRDTLERLRELISHIRGSGSY
ncbi:unnamed protein product [Hydatigera taeniaeformis]|uniref:FLYWCH-type domain-containing protein n=1 Tax=Hydatigena taeniaeformis TaxID=6205 RepID=A0A0R3WZM8_HYDTA|nr:unnamed protein product [Hydatigera taeniaeformis]